MLKQADSCTLQTLLGFMQEAESETGTREMDTEKQLALS